MKLINYIILAAVVFGSCTSDTKPEDQTEAALPENIVQLSPEQLQAAGMQLGEPERGIVYHVIKLNGMIEAPPQHIVSVSFPMAGYLYNTQLLPGMKVRKGQSIGEMRDLAIVQLQQDYLMAKSKVNYLHKEYERQRQLNINKTTSDKVLEQTFAEYESQSILMNGLKQKLRMIHIDPASLNENNIRPGASIQSPIDGYVSAVHVNVGKFITPGEALFELVNPSDPHVTLKAFEQDLPSLQRGQKVTVKQVNKPEKIYEAEVSLVSKSVQQDRSAEVHCHILSETGDLLPGMFVTGEVQLRDEEGLLLPEDAVVRYGEKQFVFIEAGSGRFEMQEVSTGAITAGKVEIRQPENISGKKLIVKNAYTALMKLKNKSE